MILLFFLYCFTGISFFGLTDLESVVFEELFPLAKFVADISLEGSDSVSVTIRVVKPASICDDDDSQDLMRLPGGFHPQIFSCMHNREGGERLPNTCVRIDFSCTCPDKIHEARFFRIFTITINAFE